MGKTVAVKLDANLLNRMLQGRPVTVNIPKDADTMVLSLEGIRASPASSGVLNELAKLADVFFNGRKA